MSISVTAITITFPGRDPIVCFTFNDGRELEILAARPIAAGQATQVRLTNKKNQVEGIYYLQEYGEAPNTFGSTHVPHRVSPNTFADYWQTALDHTNELSYQAIGGTSSDKLKAMLKSMEPNLTFLKKTYCS